MSEKCQSSGSRVYARIDAERASQKLSNSDFLCKHRERVRCKRVPMR